MKFKEGAASCCDRSVVDLGQLHAEIGNCGLGQFRPVDALGLSMVAEILQGLENR